MVDQFCLKWNNYQASLTNAFKSLLEKEDFVDVTLSAGGKTLRAHKVVLSACSSYFKQLLRGISSWQHPVLVMRDVPFVDLYTILEFIYMGEVNVAQSHLTSFLKTAELLQIKGLAENASFQDLENEDSNSGSCSDLTSSSPSSMTSQKAVKRRRLSSDTSHTSKLLNDSIPVSVPRGVDDMQFKEEMNDLEEESNLYVDESAAEQEEEMLLSSDKITPNQVVAITESNNLPDGSPLGPTGPNHKKCVECGIVMLKKNFARHMRDMHSNEPKPRSLCPLCQKSYKTSDWLKDHIRRGHGYTKELTDKLMASLKTPTKPSSESQDQASLKLQSDNDREPGLKISKPNLALIDIQSQPMTILNSLNIVKQEQNIPQT